MSLVDWGENRLRDVFTQLIVLFAATHQGTNNVLGSSNATEVVALSSIPDVIPEYRWMAWVRGKDCDIAPVWHLTSVWCSGIKRDQARSRLQLASKAASNPANQVVRDGQDHNIGNRVSRFCVDIQSLSRSSTARDPLL